MKETKIFLLGVVTSTILYPVLSEVGSCLVNLAEIGMAKLVQKIDLKQEPEEPEHHNVIGFVAGDDDIEEDYEE